jgi:hypothetical protein
MSNLSRLQHPPLEVTVMFEPHRLQQDVLQEAYACLIPRSRRPLSSGKPGSQGHGVQTTERAERRRA